MSSPVIDVSHLSKSFNGKPAVVDIALQLKPGEIFGFLGPNGSGKTTTIRMLCGLLVPDAGEGHCLGFNILSESWRIKTQVGYMTQKFSLYEDLTVRENLSFVARIYQIQQEQQKIAEILSLFDMDSRANQLAGGLSGGWKQRLALACALLHGPKLLLLDEPTAGVDPEARRDFWEKIHHLSQQGITTLVSTHYMDEAERCHRLAYIAYGHLLVQGTLHQIIDETKLTTWSITGPLLSQLGEQLQSKAGVEQVTIFGDSLHVSGVDEIQLTQAIQPFQQLGTHQFQKIRPGVEDIFISLTLRAKGNHNA